MVPNSAKRAICQHCHYPQKTCICHAVSTIQTAPDILVIQHYREANHAKNTVRLAQLCLPASRVIKVKTDDDIRQCADKLKGKRVALFFPDSNSLTLEKNVTTFQQMSYELLVFIDGSWRQSKGIARKFMQLHNCDQWQLDGASQGEYRIRRTTVSGGYSTLEAIAMALHRGFDIDASPLYRVFSAFQAQWISRIKKSDED